ncbi:hypothetical protein [Mycobacterium sp. OTB74]|uniref:hypothetical protein n=1 Tax=Mycobacterium sp. OTB74 TaxID=1853452 RepID=UPI00247366FD|nr:hypothetical protein [Mycobacterium sp. OTB74]MDH6242692.1 hypothetical protein [Mycobacterium sp. OTB74]
MTACSTLATAMCGRSQRVASGESLSNHCQNGTDIADTLSSRDLLIQDIAALDSADRRAIALQYLTFEQLVLDSDAELLDRGVRGTALYRLELPPRLARDRKPGHGGYDYFIHMRDASRPEREFVEWVDPEIGKQRHAELCQAWAFGISLDEWLSIEQEG